jgi:hypothetical protein
MVHGDPLTRAQWIGYSAATLASFFIGTKGMDKVSRAGKVAEAAELIGKGSSVAKTISKVVGKSGKIEAEGMSEETLQTLIEAAKSGNLPYNVINTAKIKKQLLVIVQESKRDYSYDLVSQIQKQKEAAAFKIKVKNVSNKTGRSMPDEDPEQLARMLKTQIAAAKVGKLPYNVINTAKLRKQLLVLAKEPGGDDAYNLLDRIHNRKQAVAVGEVHWEKSDANEVAKRVSGAKIEIIPKYDDITEYEYNIIENPGPLAEMKNVPINNFYGGRYNVKVLDKDTIYYRAGDSSNPLGQWFTTDPVGSIVKVRIDLAVKEQWINPKTGVLTGKSIINTNYAIKIPRGTTVYEGPVGFQGSSYQGGRYINQTFIKEPWNMKGIEVINSTPLK